jgi:hypothetical protein
MTSVILSRRIKTESADPIPTVPTITSAARKPVDLRDRCPHVRLAFSAKDLPEGAPRPAPELAEQTAEIEESGQFDVVAVRR